MQTEITAEKIIHAIHANALVDAIYLYGSRAKQTQRENSDWDIAVIFSHYENEKTERLVRPQLLEAAIEQELKSYNKISIVDLEIAPIYLQMAILNHGIKWFDRNVPHIKKVENSILSKWEKDYERYCL
jgi:predicted nucleotidyltransferase